MDAGGIARAFFPGDRVHHFSARRFDAGGRGSGDESELLAFGGYLAGRQLAERLAENFAALHDLEGADQQPCAHVAVGLDGNIKLHLRIGSVGRGAAQVLWQPGGARYWTHNAAGDGFLRGQHADARATRARR